MLTPSPFQFFGVERIRQILEQVLCELFLDQYPRFTMHSHTQLWKELDAKHASKGLGVLVVKTWCWYQPWLEFVESHCAANAARYS